MPIISLFTKVVALAVTNLYFAFWIPVEVSATFRYVRFRAPNNNNVEPASGLSEIMKCAVYCSTSKNAPCSGFDVESGTNNPSSCSLILDPALYSEAASQPFRLESIHLDGCPTNGDFRKFVVDNEIYCMAFYQTELTYEEAVSFCRQRNAYVVYFDNHDKVVAVFNEYVSIFGTRKTLWNGVKRDATQPIWRGYINGQQFTENDFPRWVNGQPDNRNDNEPCIEINIWSEFNDCPCSGLGRAFVCEMHVLNENA